jgi:hypothetical protein
MMTFLVAGSASLAAGTLPSAQQPGSSPERDSSVQNIMQAGAKQPGKLQKQNASLHETQFSQQIALQQLAQIDRRVHAHEQAHLAAAGAYARGGPSYTYTTGPDGKLYAVGGEVDLDVSPVPGNLPATIQKAIAVQAAAEAPEDPSPQDRRVAAAAAQMIVDAQLELTVQRARQARNASSRHGNPKAYSPPPDDTGLRNAGNQLDLVV